MKSTRFIAIAVATPLAVIAAAGGAYAEFSGAANNGTISACWSNSNLRIVDHFPCKKNEKPLTWNQKGVKGDAGAVGPQGATGANGVNGKDGSGTAGATGATGPKGDNGSAGATGPAGAPGEKGDQGAKGDQGVQGVPGISGLNTGSGYNNTWKGDGGSTLQTALGQCGPGEYATGGGFSTWGGDKDLGGDNKNIQITVSAPYFEGDLKPVDAGYDFQPTEWVIKGYNNGTTDQIVRPWVICVTTPTTPTYGAPN